METSCRTVKATIREKNTEDTGLVLVTDNLTVSTTVNYPILLCECDTDSSHKLSVMLTHFLSFFLVGVHFTVIKFYWDSTDL